MFLLDLFAVVSWSLVALVVIAVLVIGNCLESDQPEVATVAFIAALAVGGTVVYDWQTTLDFALQLPQNIGWIAIYLVIGAVWSVFKWGFYVRRLAKQLAINLAEVRQDWGTEAAKAEFIARKLEQYDYRYNGVDKQKDAEDEYANKYRNALGEAINAALGQILGRRFIADDLMKEEITVAKIFAKVQLTAGNRKALIWSWIAYWPVSILATFIREFIINLVSNIVDALKGVYNKISEVVIGKALADAIDQASQIKKA